MLGLVAYWHDSRDRISVSKQFTGQFDAAPSFAAAIQTEHRDCTVLAAFGSLTQAPTSASTSTASDPCRIGIATTIVMARIATVIAL